MKNQLLLFSLKLVFLENLFYKGGNFKEHTLDQVENLIPERGWAFLLSIVILRGHQPIPQFENKKGPRRNAELRKNSAGILLMTFICLTSF
jgi:hypothetical protein